MSQLTGKAKIRIDGKVIRTENGATLNPGGVKREPESHGGETFYSEADEPPMLECSVLLTKDVDVIALSGIKNATVMFEADTGQTFVMRDAFTTEPVSHDASGKTPLKMSAGAVERI